MDTSEKSMESAIEDHLTSWNKYIKRTTKDYDRDNLLDKQLVLDFIISTQPEKWAKLREQHGENTSAMFLKRLREEVEKRGTLDVLRKGVRDYGVSFDLFYPLPVSGLNESYIRMYEGNIFSVIRQIYFSSTTNKSIDISIFLNGLPIITIELKDKLSGSKYTVQDAIKQYREDRDPREPFLKFGRCLVHFAVDEDLVYMTTKLEGKSTKFLPFNKGTKSSAENPQTEGFRSEYLWKDILTKESLSDLIAHFLTNEQIEDEDGKLTNEKKLIFPRYHQLDAVRKLVNASKSGKSRNYLIQHSAGSGKSNTIAWLAHRLMSLHDEYDNRIFDTVVVVTDRRVLDRQLQSTVQEFEQTRGVVENIDKKSSQLKQALERGSKIIVTTLQKFPRIVDEVKNIPSKNFAVIIDEAHSSQSGENSKYLKMVLTARGLEDAEAEDIEEETVEDTIVSEMEARGKQKNVSYYAFTATPKDKTLELFGEKKPDGSYDAFHQYTMKQAIEEGFILDVLNNYTTYKSYFALLKKIKDDPNYEKSKAESLLKAFVDLSEHSINKKVEIIIEHFNDFVKDKIPGKNNRGQAKAMIVTKSRLHAVRFKQACDSYIRKNGYRFKTLVAFSGTVRDPDDNEDYTEAGMNGFSELQTAATFKNPEYRILIAANKFQTGFDQPLLYAMYVDKKLSGVAAVQTLSRLDRVYQGKENPIVMDFANDVDTIRKSFEKYYVDTSLVEGTDPNILHDQQDQLLNYHIFTQKEDVNDFARIYFDKKNRQDKVNPILNEVVTRFNDLKVEDQESFRKLLRNYIRTYAFLSQIITFRDPDLEKLYAFGRLLIRKLPVRRDSLPLEVLQQVDMESYRIELTNRLQIMLREGKGELEPKESHDYHWQKGSEEALSKIIESLNSRYGTQFTDEDKVIIAHIREKLENNEALRTSARINSKEKLKMSFEGMFDQTLLDFIEQHFELYKKINDNRELKKNLTDDLFDLLYIKFKESNTG